MAKTAQLAPNWLRRNRVGAALSHPETLLRGVSFCSAAQFTRLASLSLILVTFGLGLYLLDRYPLREDEAIYSFWALHWSHVDPWMLTVWPDKPPLLIWLLALAFDLFGPHPASARWLNVAATLLTVAVTGTMARQQWGERAGLWALLVAGLNPFALSFAATVYTDPLLTLWGMLALALALKKRFFWAGLWLGAGLVTKQQGILYLPLVLGAGWLAHPRRTHGKALGRGENELMGRKVPGTFSPSERSPSPARAEVREVPGTLLQPILHTSLGLAVPLLPVLLWDSQRWTVAPSPWDLAWRNYAPLALAPLTQWPNRLSQWADLLWYLTASWPLWIGLAGLVAFMVWRGSPHEDGWFGWMALWVLGFLAVHGLTTVQIWDRYLLPLAPLLALTIGRGVGIPFARGPVWGRGMAAGLLLLALLLPPGLAGATGQLPIGGDHGAYAGLEEAIGWLQKQAPKNAVIYHQSLGWHYRFYLFGQTGAGGYDLRWYPQTTYLADNAAKTSQRAKYLIQPLWAGEPTLRPFLAMRGLGLESRYRMANFTVYEITQPPSVPCNWCVCRPRSKVESWPQPIPDLGKRITPGLDTTVAGLCHVP